MKKTHRLFTILWGIYGVAASVLILVLIQKHRHMELEIQKLQAQLSPVIRISEADIDRHKAPSKGCENAGVVIVVYSDYECQACALGANALDKLMKKYPGEICLVFKHLPLSYHDRAVAAAAAALTAHEDGKFWEMHDLLFATDSKRDRDTLLKFAQTIGLDAQTFAVDMDPANWADYLEEERSEAMRLNVQSVPTFIINNVMVSTTDFNRVEDVFLAERNR